MLALILCESLLLVQALGTSAVAASGKKPKMRSPRPSLVIGKIKEEGLINLCGCGFTLLLKRGETSAGKYIFMDEPDEKTALMNVNGEDVKLKLIEASKRRTKERAGDRFYRKYGAANLFVLAEYVVKSVCKVNDESCETDWYSATFAVTKGRSKRLIRAEGGCGC